jgi:catechol 2,3-dioxygenase-like lactoylglutathione lyase family enzyme
MTVSHVAIAVRDLPACEEFYTSILGLPVQRRWPRIAGGDRSVWLDLGGGAFLALERADSVSAGPRPAVGPTEGYILLALTIGAGDRAAWEESLAASGVPVVKRTPYTLYVEDPEGNRIGLSHWPEPATNATPPP